MKILSVSNLPLSDVKVVRFARFTDDRGYFTEIFKKSDFVNNPETSAILNDGDFVQSNESFSKKGVMRGLHFQWDPFQGKLIRTVRGHMIDLFLDIRLGSPTFGQIGAYDMPASPDMDMNEWIWVPVGFAHGNVFLEDTQIEYFCTAEWAQGNEAAISPLAPDIDWSLITPEIKEQIEKIKENNPLMTDKDREGFTLEQWGKSVNAQKFKY